MAEEWLAEPAFEVAEENMTEKLGSLIQSQFCDGECDFCATSALQNINAAIREAYPEWFADDGDGNLLTECMDIYTKKCRAELAKRVKHEHIWQVACGFCDEPFGVCVFHLKEILQKLEQ
jgi:hypothetical protein